MATTIVSNLAVFSDSTGHGNQSHLVYATNQARWWLFNINTKTATIVKCYVSSSNDLTSATWSAGTDSPGTGMLMDGTEHRNLGVINFANGSTDVAHISITSGRVQADGVYLIGHIRCTFTGASSITWESWATINGYGNSGPTAIKGNALGISTGGFIHEAANELDATNQQISLRKSTNADTTSTWTTGFAAKVVINALVSNSVAIAKLATNSMVAVYENAGTTEPNCTGLRYNTAASGTWSTTGSADVGIGSTTQDQNDWCLCGVDTTHIYAFRRSGTNTFVCRLFDGVSTWSTPASTVPNQNHLAASGMFAATDGTDLYLFVLDSASNQPVQYVKGSTANGTITFDGSWTQLEAAGSTARNYISGCPVVGNSQIGVIFTAVNGSNFDIVVTALSIAAGGGSPFPIISDVGSEACMQMWDWAGVY